MDLGRLRAHAASAFVLGLAAALTAPQVGRAQESSAPAVDPAVAAVTAPMEAGESEADEPARQFVRWNEYEGPISTLRFGGGFLYDYAWYNQDDASEQQIDITNGSKLRDFRFLLKGK